MENTLKNQNTEQSRSIKMQNAKINYKKRLFLILLFVILFIGAFFRLYKINEYMTFLGDEGRDVLLVKRMIVDHKFTLLG
ncbi:MAG: hypothetical protein ACD_7C00176G0001, partial [uncultured bacterium]